MLVLPESAEVLGVLFVAAVVTLAVSAVEEVGEADCGGTVTEAVGVDSDEAVED